MLATMLPVAMLIGYMVHLIRTNSYLAFFFPIAMGFAVAIAGYLLIEAFRFHHPVLSCSVGLLAAVVAAVSTYYFDFISFVIAFAPQSLHHIFDVGLFLKYMDLRACDGVQIATFNMGHEGTYVYWFFEMVCCCLPIVPMMKEQASKILCERCHRWKRKQPLGSLGLNASNAAAAVDRGDLAEIARLYKADGDRGPKLSAWVCEKCTTEGKVELRLVQYLDDKVDKVLACVTCSREVLPYLETIFFSNDEPAEEGEEPA